MSNNKISMSEQERFALEMSGFKEGGHYVELGAFHSKNGSNTYCLEKNFGWNGVSFEIVEERRMEFQENRKNPCYGDALKFNYINYFQDNNFPKQIDYLQVDIDGGYYPSMRPMDPYTTLQGLITVPLSQYRFTVIVFEHDANMYYKNSITRDVQRHILDSFGYTLIRRIHHEDWWVDPSVVDHQKMRANFHWEAA